MADSALETVMRAAAARGEVVGYREYASLPGEAPIACDFQIPRNITYTMQLPPHLRTRTRIEDILRILMEAPQQDRFFIAAVALSMASQQRLLAPPSEAVAA